MNLRLKALTRHTIFLNYLIHIGFLFFFLFYILQSNMFSLIEDSFGLLDIVSVSLAILTFWIVDIFGNPSIIGHLLIDRLSQSFIPILSANTFMIFLAYKCNTSFNNMNLCYCEKLTSFKLKVVSTHSS